MLLFDQKKTLISLHNVIEVRAVTRDKEYCLPKEYFLEVDFIGHRCPSSYQYTDEKAMVQDKIGIEKWLDKREALD